MRTILIPYMVKSTQLDQKLNTIRSLMKLKDDNSRIELVKNCILQWASSGNKRLLSLQDQLSLLNLTFNGNSKPINIFNDNPILPNFPFILGFILGDGSLIHKNSFSRKFTLVNTCFYKLPQKSLNSNIHFFWSVKIIILKH